MASAKWLSGIAACLLVACGGGDDGVVVVVRGLVIDGYVGGAVVCLDANGNGRCEEGEARAASDAAGADQLVVSAGSKRPLLAEILAGQAVDSDRPGTPVDASYRMASPSKAYSTNITPFATLVHLSGDANFPLAEDLVGNELGLPPKFGIALTAAPEPGSLTRAVAKSIVVALKAAEAKLDMSDEGALRTVVAAFPPALTDLPQLRIATKNGVPIESKEVYVDATFKLTPPAASSRSMLRFVERPASTRRKPSRSPRWWR